MKEKRALRLLVICAVAVTLTSAVSTQETGSSASPQSKRAGDQKDLHKSCPMSMEQRGAMGMGFSLEKTTHHFILTRDGGVISVEANDGKDIESRNEIRMHLSHIAKAFADGDFDIPMFVHDQTPPGVLMMRSKKDQIHYRFEETTFSGRVVMTGSGQDVLSAIHEFLVFQIREHKTGDSVAVQ
jgi:hypothetical protein